MIGRGNVNWARCFWGHSLSSSCGANAVLVSPEPDEQNFTSARVSYYPQLGIIPTQGVRCHCPPPYISSGLTSPFTLWGSDEQRWANIRAWTCVLVLQCGCVYVCVGLCVAIWSRRGVGESNLSHRGAETGGQIRSRPRITPAVSMNEMTGLQGY